MSDKNKIRIGIIGVGNIGTAHANAVYGGKVNRAELSAVCDIDKKRLDCCKGEFCGVKCYSDYREMLQNEEIDGVILSVPHPLHAEIGRNLLESGKHLLLEKPIDITVSAANELINTAKKSGKIFSIMFNQRTNELYKKAHEIVQSGQLGELKRTVWIVTNWYRTQYYYDSCDWRATWSGEGGGVLLNQAPHNLDLWQWICGMPDSVTAFCDTAKYHRIEVEDDATIITRYKNGAVGTFITSTGEFPGTNRLEISGDLGKIVIENGVLKHWRLKESERRFCFDCKKCFAETEYEYSEFTDNSNVQSHISIIENFANAILEGERLISPGEDGINELIISNAAYLSEWQGNREISLPFDSSEFDELLSRKRNASHTKSGTNSRQTDGEYTERWNVRW